MTDKSYRVSEVNKATQFTRGVVSGTTPAIGSWYMIGTAGTIELVNGSTITRQPFVCTDYKTQGDGYVATLSDDCMINSNESTDFTIGVDYYSDNDGTMSTTKTNTGWKVGTAIDARTFRVKVDEMRYEG